MKEHMNKADVDWLSNGPDASANNTFVHVNAAMESAPARMQTTRPDISSLRSLDRFPEPIGRLAMLERSFATLHVR